MILLEKEIESGLRAAIRASLNAYGATVPELMTAKITGSLLAGEDGGPADDSDGLRVGIKAGTNGFNGYMPGIGPEPIRELMIDIGCISQPDSDKDRRIVCALYLAVREPFEIIPVPFSFSNGITFGGLIITPGTQEFTEVGQELNFTVKMNVSL